MHEHDLNPYLWCSYVDSVAESNFATFYDACYQGTFLSVWSDHVDPYARNGH